MKVSICIPIYDKMKNGDFFLKRCLESIKMQNFTDYEIVTNDTGSMAENTNVVINKAKGELIKILYQDDYFANENSLREIVDNFKGHWLVSGCLHDDGGVIGRPHLAVWNNEIYKGNSIGSPSVMTISQDVKLRFKELKWVLDIDFYKRMYDKYGPPKVLNTFNVVIGIGDQQETSNLDTFTKNFEEELLRKKYEASAVR